MSPHCALFTNLPFSGITHIMEYWLEMFFLLQQEFTIWCLAHAISLNKKYSNTIREFYIRLVVCHSLCVNMSLDVFLWMIEVVFNIISLTSLIRLELQLKKITRLSKEEAVLQIIFGFLLNLHVFIVHVRDYKLSRCIFPILTHFCSIHLAILNHTTRELRQNLALVIVF